MERYMNLGGDSGVVAYELGDDLRPLSYPQRDFPVRERSVHRTQLRPNACGTLSAQDRAGAVGIALRLLRRQIRRGFREVHAIPA